MSHEDDPPIRNASSGLNGQRIIISEFARFIGTRKDVSSLDIAESPGASTTFPGLSAGTGSFKDPLPPEYGINTDVYDPAEAKALYLKRSQWVKRK